MLPQKSTTLPFHRIHPTSPSNTNQPQQTSPQITGQISPSTKPAIPEEQNEDKLCAHLMKIGKMDSNFQFNDSWSRTIGSFNKIPFLQNQFRKGVSERILNSLSLRGNDNSFFSNFHLGQLLFSLETRLQKIGIYVEDFVLIGTGARWCLLPYIDWIATDLGIDKTNPLHQHLLSILSQDFSDVDIRIILKTEAHHTKENAKTNIQYALDTIVSLIAEHSSIQPCTQDTIRKNAGLLNYFICVDDKPIPADQKPNQFGIVSFQPFNKKSVDLSIGYSFQRQHFAMQDAIQISLRNLIHYGENGFARITTLGNQFLLALTHRFTKIVHLPNMNQTDPFIALPLVLSLYVKGNRTQTIGQEQYLLETLFDACGSLKITPPPLSSPSNAPYTASTPLNSPKEWYVKVVERANSDLQRHPWIPVLITGIKKTANTHHKYDPTAFFFMVLQVIPLLLENTRTKEQAPLFFKTAMEFLETIPTGEKKPPKELIVAPILKKLVEFACKWPEQFASLHAGLQLITFLSLNTKQHSQPTQYFETSLITHNQATHLKIIQNQFHLMIPVSIGEAFHQLNKQWTSELGEFLSDLEQSSVLSFDFCKDSPIGRNHSSIPANCLQLNSKEPVHPAVMRLKTLLEIALMAYGHSTPQSIPEILKIGKNSEQHIQLLDSCIRSIKPQDHLSDTLLIKLRELVRRQPQEPIQILWILAHIPFLEHSQEAFNLWKSNRAGKEITDFDRQIFKSFMHNRVDLTLQMICELCKLEASLPACMEMIDALIAQSEAKKEEMKNLDFLWGRHWQPLCEALLTRLSKQPQEILPKGTIEQLRKIAERLNQSGNTHLVQYPLLLAQRAFLDETDHNELELLWIDGLNFLFAQKNLQKNAMQLLTTTASVNIFTNKNSVAFQTFILQLLQDNKNNFTILTLALTVNFDEKHAPEAYKLLSTLTKGISKGVSQEQIDFLMAFFKSPLFNYRVQKKPEGDEAQSSFVATIKTLQDNGYFKTQIYQIFTSLTIHTQPDRLQAYCAYIHTTQYIRKTAQPKINININRSIFRCLSAQGFHEEALDLWENIRSFITGMLIEDVKCILKSLENASNIKRYQENIPRMENCLSKTDWKACVPILRQIYSNVPPQATAETLTLTVALQANSNTNQLLELLEAYYSRISTQLTWDEKIRILELALKLIDAHTPENTIFLWIPHIAAALHRSNTLVTLVSEKQDHLLPLYNKNEIHHLAFFKLFFHLICAGSTTKLKIDYVSDFFPIYYNLIKQAELEPEFPKTAVNFFLQSDNKGFLVDIPGREQLKTIARLIEISPNDSLITLIAKLIEIVDKEPVWWRNKQMHQRCQQWIGSMDTDSTNWIPILEKLSPWEHEGWEQPAICKVFHSIIKDGPKQTLNLRLQLLNQFWNTLKEHISHERLARTLQTLFNEHQTLKNLDECAAILIKLTDFENLSPSFCTDIFETFINYKKEKKTAGAQQSTSSSQLTQQPSSNNTLAISCNTPVERRSFIFGLTWKNLVCGKRLKQDFHTAPRLIKLSIDSHLDTPLSFADIEILLNQTSAILSFFKTSLKGDEQFGLLHKFICMISMSLNHTPPSFDVLKAWNTFQQSLLEIFPHLQDGVKKITLETILKKLTIILMFQKGWHEKALKIIDSIDVLIDTPSSKLAPELEIALLSDEVNVLTTQFPNPSRAHYLKHRFHRLSTLMKNNFSLQNLPKEHQMLPEPFFKKLNDDLKTRLPTTEYLEMIKLIFMEPTLTTLGLELLQILPAESVSNKESIRKLSEAIEFIQGEHTHLEKLQSSFFKWRLATELSCWQGAFLDLHNAILKRIPNLPQNSSEILKISVLENHLLGIEQSLTLFAGIRSVESALFILYANSLELPGISFPLPKFASRCTYLIELIIKSCTNSLETVQENHDAYIKIFATLAQTLRTYAENQELTPQTLYILCTFTRCILKLFTHDSLPIQSVITDIFHSSKKLVSVYDNKNSEQIRELIETISNHAIGKYLAQTLGKQSTYSYAHIEQTVQFSPTLFTSEEIYEFTKAYFANVTQKSKQIHNFELGIQYLALVNCGRRASQSTTPLSLNHEAVVTIKLQAFLENSEMYLIHWLQVMHTINASNAFKHNPQIGSILQRAVQSLMDPALLKNLSDTNKLKWKDLVSQIIPCIYNHTYFTELLNHGGSEIFKNMQEIILPRSTKEFDFLEEETRKLTNCLMKRVETEKGLHLLK